MKISIHSNTMEQQSNSYVRELEMDNGGLLLTPSIPVWVEDTVLFNGVPHSPSLDTRGAPTGTGTTFFATLEKGASIVWGGGGRAGHP